VKRADAFERRLCRQADVISTAALCLNERLPIRRGGARHRAPIALIGQCTDGQRRLRPVSTPQKNGVERRSAQNWHVRPTIIVEVLASLPIIA